jgi:hypothetical protein
MIVSIDIEMVSVRHRQYRQKNILIVFRQKNMPASIFSTGKKIEMYILVLLYNADVRLS